MVTKSFVSWLDHAASLWFLKGVTPLVSGIIFPDPPERYRTKYDTRLLCLLLLFMDLINHQGQNCVKPVKVVSSG